MSFSIWLAVGGTLALAALIIVPIVLLSVTGFLALIATALSEVHFFFRSFTASGRARNAADRLALREMRAARERVEEQSA